MKNKCSDNKCPTPNETFDINDLTTYNDKSYCLFCYTKLLSQNSQTIGNNIVKKSTTKYIEEEKITRIKANNKYLTQFSGDGASRIPSTENIKAEKEIWKEILLLLDISKRIDTGSLISVVKLANCQGWVIKTSTIYLLVKMDLHFNRNQGLENQIIALLSEIQYKTHQESIEKVTMRAKRWLATSLSINIEELLEYNLIIYEFEDSVIILDEFDFSSKEHAFLRESATNFGNFIYRSWFMGYLNPYELLLITREDTDSLDFISFSNLGEPFKIEFIEYSYKNMAIKMPFVLEYLDDFDNGIQIEKDKITQLLKQEKFSTLIKSFYFEDKSESEFTAIENFLADIPPFYSKLQQND